MEPNRKADDHVSPKLLSWRVISNLSKGQRFLLLFFLIFPHTLHDTHVCILQF